MNFVSKNEKHQDITILAYEDDDFLTYNLLPKSVYHKLPFKIISTELNKKNASLIEKLSQGTKALGDLIEITRGVEAGKSDRSITEKKTPYKLIAGQNIVSNIRTCIFALMSAILKNLNQFLYINKIKY